MQVSRDRPPRTPASRARRPSGTTDQSDAATARGSAGGSAAQRRRRGGMVARLQCRPGPGDALSAAARSHQRRSAPRTARPASSRCRPTTTSAGPAITSQTMRHAPPGSAGRVVSVFIHVRSPQRGTMNVDFSVTAQASSVAATSKRIGCAPGPAAAPRRRHAHRTVTQRACAGPQLDLRRPATARRPPCPRRRCGSAAPRSVAFIICSRYTFSIAAARRPGAPATRGRAPRRPSAACAAPGSRRSAVDSASSTPP